MNVQIKPAPLPVSVAELKDRKAPRAVNLNDDLDRVHLALWENPNYRRYLEGAFDADTVEGSKVADDFEAAAMIRDYCKKPGNDEYAYIGKKNKQTIVRHLNVVLRRYHMSRNERAQTVNGQFIPANNVEAA